MKRFTPVAIPWLAGGLGLAVYLLTLNHWVSITNLSLTARAVGTIPGQQLLQPASFLVLYPIRWLPASAIPMAMNVFSAVCASLTLVLLARSVMLMPQDRTQGQRDRESSKLKLLIIPPAWVPALLATFAVGLQISFWEEATAASADIFDLLLFAYVVRCLLEFQAEDRPS